MEKLRYEFLVAIAKAFRAYNRKGGARSTKKLEPIHRFLAKTILREIGNNFSVKSLGFGDGKEAKLEGKYYTKDLDIAIVKHEKIITTVSFKFVTSNYKQNANNYFEGMMGETANIRRKNVGFAHFLVLRGHTPYYSKNKGNLRGKEQKIEKINDKDLQKYIKLFKDADFPHKPDLMGICVIDFDRKGVPVFVDFRDFDFSQETQAILASDFSLEGFLNKLTHFIGYKDSLFS